MNLSTLPLFAALNGRFEWLAERNEVLARNIANADTPDYLPQDLKAPSFADLLARASAKLGLRTTNARHVLPVAGAERAFATTVDADVEVNTVGNGVEVERELMKLSETEAAYQLATGLYKKHVDLMKLALGRSSNG
jgi:flagellar basal-body rod protein FlgB